MSVALASARVPLADLQKRFAAILPAVEEHARDAFRRVRCPHDRADRVADVVLAAWRSFLRRITENAPTNPDRIAADAVAFTRRHVQRHAFAV